MNSMLEQLLAHAPVVTDGAIGTELQARGLDNGECPDVWNLARPAEVEALTRAYVEAGSDIVLTNTFRSNPLALARHRRAEQAEEFNLAGVEIARRATAGRARIFGCIGPSGKILMMGETSEVELRGAFSAQVRTLAAAGVEGLAIETMAELDEARVALAAALETGLPVMVSMVFDSGRDQDRTMTGVTPERAAQELTAAGAHIIGANCGRGIARYGSICQRLKAATDRPIWIKPNAGMPELVDGKAIYRTTPEEFAAFVPAVLQAGVSFIGGCCGTNPEFIRATAETARRWRRR
jgi:5-methyltetrahydrofolate--homocysteine methyltransferase